MGRLIDADDFFARMENDTDLCAEMEADGLKALKKYLDIQPTAFDVDKVVEQLEEVKKRATELCLAIDDGAQRLKYIEKEQTIALAIEIVKAGGKDD